MGSLIYGDEQFDFDDRQLFHLQVVFSTKLRRHEAFFFAWNQALERGSGRHAVWIDNGVPIHFFYNGSRTASVNRQWIEDMLVESSRATGLLLTDEPTTPPA